jgi:hypothetical protein
MNDGEVISLQIAGNNITPEAVGVIGNLTVVGATGPGHMVVYETNNDPLLGEPGISNLNFHSADALANMVMSRLGWSQVDQGVAGKVSIHAHVYGGGSVDVIFDMLGYTT